MKGYMETYISVPETYISVPETHKHTLTVSGFIHKSLKSAHRGFMGNKEDKLINELDLNASK